MKKLGGIIYLVTFVFSLYSGTVYIVPPCFGVQEKDIFNPKARDGCGLPFCMLRKTIMSKGHTCTILPQYGPQDQDCWFIALEAPSPEVHAILSRYPNDRRILLMFEPPSILPNNYNLRVHEHFKVVLTLFHEMVDYLRYFPLYYPQPYLYQVSSDVVPFEKKKLCTMVIGYHMSGHPLELYSQRLQIINFFEKNAPKDFDFYGIGWNGKQHPCYKGKVKHKLPYIKNYKFAICYENMRSETYITEKIFDIMHAGCVPVYCGGKKITEYIPYKAYILRDDFKSDAELYHFLNSMTAKEYQAYLDAAQQFFKSDHAIKFSIPSFIDNVLTLLFNYHR